MRPEKELLLHLITLFKDIHAFLENLNWGSVTEASALPVI